MTDEATQNCELSILMPCLNEERTVGLCIDQASEAIRRLNISAEIVVADNGSTDRSVEIAESKGARVVPIPEKGLGHALVGGTAACKGKYIITADSDCSYDLSIIQPFLDKLRDGHDLVIGNRFLGGIAPGAMPFLHYWLGNPVLSWTGRTLFRSKIGDFHSGQRGYSRDWLLALGLRCGGMEYCSEMIAKAEINHWRIAEVPVTLSPDKRGRKSHLRTWQDGWRHLTFMLMMCPRWMFRNPGLAFMISGLVLGLLSSGESSIRLVFGLILTCTGAPLLFLYFFLESLGHQQQVLPRNAMETGFEKFFRRGGGYFFGVGLIVAGSIATSFEVSPFSSLTAIALGLEAIGFNHFFYVVRFMLHAGSVDGIAVSDFAGLRPEEYPEIEKLKAS